MPLPKHIVMVAGEESGDSHAAHLARQLLNHDPTLQISGVGGQHMEDAGVHLISDLARFGSTGFTEVIAHSFIIYKAFKAIKAHLKTTKPQLLILIDCPSFNLRIAKYAKLKLGLRIVYYISPQIWAWKPNRIKLIHQCIDRMAVILPFEKAIYEKAGVPVSFVGHPLVDKIPSFNDLIAVRRHLNLPLNKKIIALLPGSRRNEIEHHLPILAKTAQQLSIDIPGLHFVIPIARSLTREKITPYFSHSSVSISFIEEQAVEVAACSDCVVVASGTASLECALLLKPMCIVYKVSWLTYLIASKVIKVKYLGLCNLLQNKMIVPELLQYDFNVKELVLSLKKLLLNQEASQQIQHRLTQLKKSLSAEKADCSMQTLVQEELARE